VSELLRLVRERLEGEILEPVRETMGEGTAVERTALVVLRIVEEAEHELATRWITLREAVERSGYSYDSIVRYAAMIHGGEEAPEPWADMVVRKGDSGQWEVQAGSVPVKMGRVA